MPTKLFIAAYPLDIQEIELIEMFIIYGMVHSIHLVADKKTRKHKGYGFIEMEDKCSAEQAVGSLNGTTIRGRTITVKLSDENGAKKIAPLKTKSRISLKY